jgi:hypothetical protein
VLVVVVAAMKNNACAVRASAVGRLAPSGAVGARRCVHKIVMECGSIETHSVRQLPCCPTCCGKQRTGQVIVTLCSLFMHSRHVSCN